MTLVTVSVPAYRAAPFIGQTLESIRSQTYTDYRVEIGLEPDDAAATMDACRPFLGDRRFRLHANPTTLGWDGNVRAMLRRIETPYFVVLPHDDLWHPTYLASLMEVLHDRPDATVALADTYLFGDASGVRWIDLPDAGLADRVLAFFLGGAEGMLWRGLTRSEVLDEDFPGNPFRGFAVECEWSMHLVLRGVALRVPRPLYLKRGRLDEGSVSVGWRFTMPEPMLRSALDHHRSRLLELVARAGLPDEPRRWIELAAEAAMLLRWVHFGHGRFELDAARRRRIDDVVRACDDDGSALARAIRGRILFALSRHALQRGDEAEGRRLALAAVEDAPDWAEAAVHLARLHLQAGRVLDALPLLHRAAAVSPMATGLRELEATCAKQFVARYPYTAERVA